MPLRPYQNEILAAVRRSYQQGIRQQLVLAATGTGKTTTFSHMPSFLQDLLPGRTLVLAHREELIDQGLKTFELNNPNLHVTKEMGGIVGDVNADVIMAGVATLGRSGSTRADRFPWEQIDKVITDEAHHGTSDSYTNVYRFADVLRPDTHRLHVGFTATGQRADGKAMAEVFKRVVYEYSLRRAIEEGYLVEPHGIRIRTNTSLAEVKTGNGGDYSTQSLVDAINNPERNQLVVKAWLDHGVGRKTIGFTANIQHAKDLCDMFRYYNVRCEYIWGEDPERAWKIARHQGPAAVEAFCIKHQMVVPRGAAMEALMYDVLLNCGVLTEGYDDPQISCILLARPTKSGVLYCQMVGRGTRLFLGKIDCIVIDVVDATAKNSLLTLPTLMGLSTTLDMKGRGLWDTVKKLEEAAKEYPQIDFSQLADIDSLNTFIQSVNLFEVKFTEEVETNSDLTWYSGPTGGYVLNLPKDEELVEKEKRLPREQKTPADRVQITQNLLDKYEVYAKIKGKSYRGLRDSIGEAFSVADDLIQDKAPEALTLLRRNAHWHGVPASEKQIKLLKKLYKGRAIPLDLDKGAASKLISAATNK